MRVPSGARDHARWVDRLIEVLETEVVNLAELQRRKAEDLPIRDM